MQWNTIRENRHKGFIKHQVLETKVVIHPTAHYSYQQALGDLLHEQKNYWLELGGHEKGRYLFDCKSDVIDLLLRYSYGSNDCFPRFAIIDKKYTGLSI